VPVRAGADAMLTRLKGMEMVFFGIDYTGARPEQVE